MGNAPQPPVATTIAITAEIANLQRLQRGVLQQLDSALDQGDRASFVAWVQRLRTVQARLEKAVLTALTPPETPEQPPVAPSPV